MSCTVMRTSKVRITSPYGMRNHPIQHANKFHKGVDIVPVAPGENIVLAFASGVLYQAEDAFAGKHVVIQHEDNTVTKYFHLAKFLLSPGSVAREMPIGVMGATGAVTGAHLHFQIEVNGKTIDPEPYLYKYMEGLDMTEQQVREIVYKMQRETAAAAPANDPDSVEARKVMEQLGIISQGEWRRPVTRNEMAIAINRLYKLLQKELNR